jgi:nitrite reductase/ring-hydroxylating ferredoxin subunit
MAFVPIIEISRCPLNKGAFVAVGSRELAVFRLSDPERVIVTDNACPHASGNLSGGSIENGVVTCPWHEWPFDLSTGVCTHSDKARLVRYPNEVRDGMIVADLDNPIA